MYYLRIYKSIGGKNVPRYTNNENVYLNTHVDILHTISICQICILCRNYMEPINPFHFENKEPNREKIPELM